MEVTTIPLTSPQQTIFDDENRFRVVSAGRRFGKTYLSMYEIARVARFPGKRIFYVAPSYRMGKQIIWSQMCDEMRQRRWVRKINESDLTITLINGSKISVRSADNFDSMRGVSLDFVVLDECAYMSKEVWTEVLRPTLSDREGGLLAISTPKGYNWFHDMFIGAASNANWANYQYTTVEGGNVTADEVEAARSDLPLKTYKQEYEASFENAGHLIYYGFNREQSVRKYTDDVPRVIHVGMDFNTNPMSAVICRVDRTGVHVFDEISLPNSHTDELASELNDRYAGHQIVVYPDPAGAARKTSSAGRTDHAILQQWGFTVKARRAHSPVRDRINAVNRVLEDAAGVRTLHIDPKCKTTIECITKHQYKEGTTTPDKDSGYDHMNDSLGYLVDYLYPIRKPQTTPTNESQIFGHF